MLPGVSYLSNTDVQAACAKEVAAQYRPSQLEMEGVTPKPDIAAIVAKTDQLVIQQTIDIPASWSVPTGKVQSGFNSSRSRWTRSTIHRSRRSFGPSICGPTMWM